MKGWGGGVKKNWLVTQKIIPTSPLSSFVQAKKFQPHIKHAKKNHTPPPPSSSYFKEQLLNLFMPYKQAFLLIACLLITR